MTENGNCKCVPGYAGNGFLCGIDTDQDGIPDNDLDCDNRFCKADNCPNNPNSGQEDNDEDGMGDDCDDDPDNDGAVFKKKTSCNQNNTASIYNQYLKCKDSNGCEDENASLLAFLNCFETDNCENMYNPDQKDTDLDGVGDKCDNCLKMPNSNQHDTDKDGKGDVCDNDVDNDGIENIKDNCKNIQNEDQKDTDGDGVGDLCDNCLLVKNKEQKDINRNRIGDECEKGEDKDKDGLVGEADNCPEVFNADQKDTDNDSKYET